MDVKTKWDMVVNDRAFRRKFTGCKGDYDISKCRRIVHPKGTLYVPISDDEGHFMAYEFVGSAVIRVFDPAHPKSLYSGHLDRAHISKLSGRRVVVCKDHPQLHEEDTFCATWTLAWLRPDMRHLTQKSDNSVQEKNLPVALICG
jgi:hypothetical protein